MEVMRSLKDGGHLDRLHHPQAARGQGGRRPDHRDPPRQGGRRGQPDVVGGRAGLDDGRPPGGARRRQGARRSPATRCSTSRASGRRRRRAGARRRRQLLRARRRDPRPRRRPGQRPDRAHRGAGRAEPGRAGHGSRSTAATSRGPGSTTSSAPGVGYVPEDRLHDGLVSSFTVAENLVLDLYDREPFSQGRRARPRRDPAERRASGSRSSTSARRRSSIPRRTLSGGNQQKVVLARELSRPLKVLIVAQPTRGLDVGSIEFVHKRIVDRARQRRRRDRRLHRARRGARPRRPDRGHVPRARSSARCPVGPTPDEIGLLMAGTVAGQDDGGGVVSEHRPDRRPPASPGSPSRAAAGDAAGPAGSDACASTHPGRPSLAFVSALVDRRRPDRRRRPGHPAAASYFFSVPVRHVHRRLAAPSAGPTSRCSRARSSTRRWLSKGTLTGYLGPALRDPGQRHPADPRRPVGGPGVPRRPVQHRRPGPDHHRRDLRRVRRLPLAPAGRASTCSSAILAGMLGGALWGGLAGLLKARTGAHEVITTIMLNYIAFYLLAYLLSRQGLPGAAVRPGDLQPRRPTARSCRRCSAAACASTPA